MVESLPSQGTPARDPDHPTSSGESVGNRDAEASDTESRETKGDPKARKTEARWVAEIAAVAARADPVPDEVVQEARRALRARRGKKSVGPRGSSGSQPG